jgi:hypothetical protein
MQSFIRCHSLRIFCNSFCKLQKTGVNTARTLYFLSFFLAESATGRFYGVDNGHEFTVYIRYLKDCRACCLAPPGSAL